MPVRNYLLFIDTNRESVERCIGGREEEEIGEASKQEAGKFDITFHSG